MRTSIQKRSVCLFHWRKKLQAGLEGHQQMNSKPKLPRPSSALSSKWALTNFNQWFENYNERIQTASVPKNCCLHAVQRKFIYFISCVTPFWVYHYSLLYIHFELMYNKKNPFIILASSGANVLHKLLTTNCDYIYQTSKGFIQYS